MKINMVGSPSEDQKQACHLNPSLPLLAETKITVQQRDIYFIEALFTTARLWNQSIYPSCNGVIKKIPSTISLLELYSVI